VGLVYFNNKTGRKPQVVSVANRVRMRLSPEIMERMGCKACPLDKAESMLRSPKMRPTGTRNPLIYILGEAPGEREDEEDEQFIGPSGNIARDAVRRAFNLRKRDDENQFVRWNNTIRCHPPKNRDPDPVELICCMPKQFDDIAWTKPRVIMALGKVALESLIDEGSITAWRGRAVAYQRAGHACWLVPSVHPAYVLRMGGNGGSKDERKARDLRRFFEDDVKLAADLAQWEKPPQNLIAPETIYDDVRCIRRHSDILTALRRVDGNKWAATDIETTGKRPFHDKAAILTASICDGKKTIAFPICHPEAQFSTRQQDEILNAYHDALLRCKATWAHNLNFEFEWLAWQYGPEFIYKLNGQDTMAQAYILDERGGALSLNDLCQIHLGIKIKELAELDKADMKNEPLETVLPYNGVDSKVCSRIAVIQQRLLIEEVLEHIYDEHRKTSYPVAIMQNLGMKPDHDEAERLDDKYRAEENIYVDKIMANRDVVDYTRNRPKFNLNAPKDVGSFLSSLGFHDAAGKADEATLKTIDHPVAEDILKVREFKKLRSTYIVPFLGERRDRRGRLISERGKNVHDDGFIHTQFKHLLTTTGRLSSTEPNMQNLPAREHPDVRGIIGEPSLYEMVRQLGERYRKETGWWIVGGDYGQIEARVVAMASKDKYLCQSIIEGHDIHGEWAERIAYAVPRTVGGKENIKDKTAMKAFRSKVKNKWTFPLFYLAGLYSISMSFGCEPDELESLFNEFWDQLPGVKEWQEQLLNFYDDKGYVECLTGHRRHGPMTTNMIVNSPIQGTASHIVVDGMKRLSKHAVTTGDMHLHPRLNVHDDLTFYLPDYHLEENMDFIAGQMLSCDFAFINVPLTIEMKVGKNWGKMKDVAVLSSDDYK
jgi:uracil-DNA glycosylase family 4